MGDLGAGGSSHQRGNALVTEQVQNLDGTPACSACCLTQDQWTICSGKHADMAKGSKAPEEIHVEQRKRPCFTQCGLGKAPAPHAVFIRIAGKYRIGIVPDMRGKAWTPERLRLGPHDAVGAVLLQLQTGTAIDQMKITPRPTIPE